MFTLFDEHREHLENLKAMNFDIGLAFILPVDGLFVRYMEIPTMTWASFIADPVMTFT